MSYGLSLDNAVDLAGYLLAEAEKSKVKVSISVVDSSGQLLAFLRIPGAAWSSIEISKQKAVTSVSFQSTTLAVAKVIESESVRVQQQIYNRPDIMLLGGGHPIYVDGELVGAIGVSGSTEKVDENIAEQGLLEFKKHCRF
jgi:uncharacterized protein GlcG (DUF336 family)